MSGVAAGRYELEDLPARGSMGDVFPAYDLRLDRRVAVKRIRPELVGDAEAVKRFEREARLTARASHPGVPPVFDFGSDDSGPYLVLDYVDGQTLADLINEVRPLSQAWVAAIGAQICAILDHTHAVSLIHRDLTPANILLRADGTVAIIDFGVAAVVGASRLSTLTGSGMVVGTPDYQAPERRLGVESPLTDLYAVGRVLCDLATAAGPQILALVDELTAARPQDRPVQARAVVDRLVPLIGSLEPLPGFVPDVRDVAARIAAFTAATPAPVARPAGLATLADLAHLRRRAARHADGGRFRQAVEVLDYLMDVAAANDAPVAIEVRRDRARWMFEGGDMARASVELASVADALSGWLGPQHPAVTSSRLMLAQAHAACGRVENALGVLQGLVSDLADAHGPQDPALYPARLELGTQLAVAGETAQSLAVLESLAADQRGRVGPHAPELAVTLDTLAAI